MLRCFGKQQLTAKEANGRESAEGHSEVKVQDAEEASFGTNSGTNFYFLKGEGGISHWFNVSQSFSCHRIKYLADSLKWIKKKTKKTIRIRFKNGNCSVSVRTEVISLNFISKQMAFKYCKLVFPFLHKTLINNPYEGDVLFNLNLSSTYTTSQKFRHTFSCTFFCLYNFLQCSEILKASNTKEKMCFLWRLAI